MACYKKGYGKIIWRNRVENTGFLLPSKVGYKNCPVKMVRWTHKIKE